MTNNETGRTATFQRHEKSVIVNVVEEDGTFAAEALFDDHVGAQKWGRYKIGMKWGRYKIGTVEMAWKDYRAHLRKTFASERGWDNAEN